MTRTLTTLLLYSVIIVCSTPITRANGNNEIVTISEVAWEKLNPARGDKSPRAATLWGDRQADVATGFLVAFVDGFRSPPHIHNVTYRGIVIDGLIHNDDPGAADMWMPTGSFWTQPKGEVHITAASGGSNLAYIEIEAGPYLVRPIEESFDSGERPVNIHASNVLWQRLPTAKNTAPSPSGNLRIAYLWGDPNEDQPNGALLRMKPGHVGEIESADNAFRAVVIQGQLDYRSGIAEVSALMPGSYFGSRSVSSHPISCASGIECILYIRAERAYVVR